MEIPAITLGQVAVPAQNEPKVWKVKRAGADSYQ
jgi:hypothetical protein